MKALINEYLKYYSGANDRDLIAVVKSRRGIADQIEAATLSVNSKGLMHGHQRRVGHQKLKKYAMSMLSDLNIGKIQKALKTKQFHSVYSVFKEEAKNHHMVGHLTAYDATQRLCAAYDICPDYIYLHTGTTVGAGNLGIDTRGKEYLVISEIPKWITSSLSPADIENFLCIYKKEFLVKSNKKINVKYSGSSC